MERWWRGGIVGGLMTLVACGVQSPGAPDPAIDGFRSLRRATISEGAPLPTERVRVAAYVISVRAFRGGTIMELADPHDRDEQLLVVYGSAADSKYAQHLQGQVIELEFTATAHVTVPDGRPAVRIAVSGLKAVPASPAQ
jgi:hypothetical protein